MSEIQWFTGLVILIGLVLEVLWAKRNKSCSLLAVPWIILYIHTIIFYVALLVHPGTEIYQGENDFALWSSILRAHSYITIVGYALYRKNQRSCL